MDTAAFEQTLAMMGIADETILRRDAVRRFAAAVRQTQARERDLRGGILNALARFDGHTCHAGHTDADHLRLYRQVVQEIESVLERTA